MLETFTASNGDQLQYDPATGRTYNLSRVPDLSPTEAADLRARRYGRYWTNVFVGGVLTFPGVGCERGTYPADDLATHRRLVQLLLWCIAAIPTPRPFVQIQTWDNDAGDWGGWIDLSKDGPPPTPAGWDGIVNVDPSLRAGWGSRI